jgi:hypothetical protein
MIGSWTEEELDLVRRLSAQGYNSTQIALQLKGRTRNSVIGLMHRNNIPLPKRVAAPKAPKAPPKPKPITKMLPSIKIKTKIETKPLIERKEERDERNVRLFDARYYQCRYIVHKPDDMPYDTMCCGKSTFNNSSWCKEHYAIVFVPKERKMK